MDDFIASECSGVSYVGDQLVTLLESPDASITLDDMGVGAATMSFNIQYVHAVSAIEDIKRHPDYDWLIRTSADVKRGLGGVATVVCKFEGVDPAGDFDVDNEDKRRVVYGLQGATGSMPIETHPEFHTFAGNPTDPESWVNGASFVSDPNEDDYGRFLGFTAKLVKDDKNNIVASQKAGITSYLEAGYLFTETRVYSTKPTGGQIATLMNTLGEIDEPDSVEEIVNLNPRANYNWLLVTCDVETIGDGLRITRKWRLSGRRGWDPQIYATVDTEE